MTLTAAAYRRIVERGHDLALVLEDDALFVTDRARAFRLSNVPSDFEMLFLNSFLLEEPPLDRVVGNVFRDTSYNGSAAAYLITGRAAGKLLAASLPVVHAADGLLGRVLHALPGESHAFRQAGVGAVLRSYLVHPDVVLNGSTSYYHISDVQPR